MDIFERLYQHLAHDEAVDDLQSLFEQDLAELAPEPQALRGAVVARPNAREQMLAMAARYGLNEEEIAAEHWQEMDILTACQNCKSAYPCQRFLNGEATSFTPSDCPNAETYGNLARARR